jgi:L-aspartate oxidase
LPSFETAPRELWGRPVIVGGGVAGMMAALSLNRPSVLLDPKPIGGEASSLWAQGGLAAAVGPDDSPEVQVADTIAAGAGLVDAEAARRIIGRGPETVAALEGFGVRFDRAPDGSFGLGLEAAHARRRILHVRDATGRAIVEALAARVRVTPAIAAVEAAAVGVAVVDGGVVGVWLRRGGDTVLLPTGCVVLATGGVGGLWRSTTNPVAARGAGVALAGAAGATLADLEFVQFHPTALAAGIDPMPLISEAVRGENATLIGAAGERFMSGTPGGELAPRDVVARAVFAEWAKGGRAMLDTRHWPAGRFAGRFPNIHRVLAGQGIDPERDAIPVKPAAHYHMGGVHVDEAGRTDVPGLWACGEVACTGLHGANRLASNSLLEAAVCGRIVAENIAGAQLSPAAPVAIASPPSRPADPVTLAAVRDVMDRDVGVIRDKTGLARAAAQLAEWRRAAQGTTAEPALGVALLIALCALRRHESCGAHWRADAVPAVEALRSTARWSELEEQS